MAPESLKDYLGAAQFVNETAETIKECGIATGLAWTPVGGEILFIEATRMPGKGGLLLTGSLGDVMKESAQTAVSYLRSQAKPLGIDLSDYAKYDLHIHVPAGATPKDGPSAGVTLVAALASLLTRRRVRSDVAMTGEISLRGRVMRVGGIKEKVLAAARFRHQAGHSAGAEPAGLERGAGGSPAQAEGAFHPAHLRTAAAGLAREMKRSGGHPKAKTLRDVRRKQAGKSEARKPKPGGSAKSEARISAALRGQRSVVASAALPCQSLIRKPFPRTISARAFRISDFGTPSDFGVRISSFPSTLLCRLVPLLLLSISVCLAQRQNDPRPAPLDPVEAVEQARALVSDMLAQRPDQNTTNTGRVTIRDAAGKEREIPVRFEITCTPTGWESVYETLPSAGSPGGTKLTVIHAGEQPNRYELINPAAPGATNAVAQHLTQDQIMAPFAGSDFWIADLGLGVSALAKATVVEEGDAAQQVLLRAGERQPAACPGRL